MLLVFVNLVLVDQVFAGMSILPPFLFGPNLNMKTKIIITLLLFSTIITSFAKQIDSTTAKQVGMRFLTTKTNSIITEDKKNLKLEYLAKYKGTANSGVNYFYIFNLNSSGFVIVSADDIVIPILGYSTTNKFDATNIPDNAAKWLEGYVNQIRYAIENNSDATDEITSEWQELLNNNAISNIKPRAGSVSPMIKTTWSQSPYYNELCPFDKIENKYAVTGCVATAMAQIMKYWNYPQTGSGFHSYNNSNYGTLSAPFSSTTYQWSSMPNKVTSYNSAVATLMFHCGVSVDMSYGVGGSSAYPDKVAPALKDYFGYSNSAALKVRVNFTTDNQWISLLKQELDAGRPLFYSGAGVSGTGGHAFVCDGYTNSDYFHFNWGWGGSNDGNFSVNALNTSNGKFNNYQTIVSGIEPPSGLKTYNMVLYNDVLVSPTTNYYGNAFTVETNILNKGTTDFSGDYCAAIFDYNYNFIDFIETKTGYNLQSGYVYSTNLIFTANANLGRLPGIYYVGIFYKPTGGNWTIVSNNGSYTNLTQLNIINPSEIELYSDITVTPGTELTQGKSATVNFNITNSGTSTFYGKYQANLYKLDGTFVQTINTVSENNGLPSGSYYSSLIALPTSAITAEPGTYLLAIIHNRNGSADWYYTGSSYFQNPIIVTVKAQPIQPDKYEVNNSNATAYNLPLTFSNNTATKNTVGSNCHVSSDMDYYKINLPAGFLYTITPRLHDLYNSGNGNVYTLDALFSYSTDGSTWSDAYDDVLSTGIKQNGGTTLYFAVSPYFQGQIGTYLLDMKITRTSTASIDESDLTKTVNIYPNPTNGEVYVHFQSTNEIIGDINLLNIQGQLISKIPHSKKEEEVSFSMAQYPSGVYFVQIQLANGSITKKLILNK